MSVNFTCKAMYRNCVHFKTTYFYIMVRKTMLCGSLSYDKLFLVFILYAYLQKISQILLRFNIYLMYISKFPATYKHAGTI